MGACNVAKSRGLRKVSRWIGKHWPTGPGPLRHSRNAPLSDSLLSAPPNPGERRGSADGEAARPELEQGLAVSSLHQIREQRSLCSRSEACGKLASFDSTIQRVPDAQPQSRGIEQLPAAVGERELEAARLLFDRGVFNGAEPANEIRDVVDGVERSRERREQTSKVTPCPGSAASALSTVTYSTRPCPSVRHTNSTPASP